MSNKIKQILLKTGRWVLHHGLTIASCALITVLGIAFIVWSSPGTTTIGENISTNDLTVSGNATTTGNLNVTGTTTVSGNLNVTGTTTVSGNLNAKTGRTATLVVAASDATAAEKAQADYVCDGTADDVEIQAAVNASEEVKLSTGTFNISNKITIPSNRQIVGSGVATRVTLANNVDDVVFINSDYTNASGGNTNIVIRDMLIDGNNLGQGASAVIMNKYAAEPDIAEEGIGTITFSYVTGFALQNLTILNGWLNGIEIVNSSNGEVSNNHVAYAGDDNIGIDGKSSYIKIIGNDAYDIGLYKQKTGATGLSDIEVEDCHDISVVGNNMYQTTAPETFDVNGLYIVRHAGYAVATYNIVASGNTVNMLGGDVTAGYYARGITISSPDATPVQDVSIVGNTVRISGTATHYLTQSIYITGLTMKDILIVGNIIDSPCHGIYLDTALTITNLIISNNKLADLWNVYGSSSGIRVTGTAISIKIIGNIAYNFGNMPLYFTNTSNVTKAEISGNSFYGGNYGIYFHASASLLNVIIHDNYLSGSLTNIYQFPASGVNAYRNLGYVTENSSTATITAGQTSTTTDHGLATTPTRVQLTPTTDTGGQRYWVSGKGATTFTITIDSATTSDITFDWRAVIGEGN